MAYYDALIAKWPSIAGANTAAKLAAINTLTVPSAQKALLSVNDIINAIQPADFPNTQIPLMQMQLLIGGRDVVDASIGTTIRSVFTTIFAGKTATLAALGALVAPYDNATQLWITANGYGLIGLDDLRIAGGLS